MGWRDINMNRRKPPLNRAVIPVAEGMDLRHAVIRKAAASAIQALGEQLDVPPPPALAPFIRGYLHGFGRQSALRHGIDCEQSSEDMSALSAILARAGSIPGGGEDFSVTSESRGWPARAALKLTPPLADAGYLAGHLEALCGSGRLARQAVLRLQEGGMAAASYLTDCDVAADPMQTRAPTLSLRFSPDEREAVRQGLETLHPQHLS